MSDSQTLHADDRTVVVLTGFLGSGKTTLLSKLLQHRSMEGAAVIVNEFGEIPLDHHLVRMIDERTAVLASGCICCSLRSDLADEMRDLIDRSARGEVPPFGHVVIETTGLADPAPIVNTILSDPVLRHQYSVGGVVTTVDAMHGLGDEGTEDAWTRQVTAADRLCVTKTDLAPGATVEEVEARLRELNPLASIVRCPVELDDVPALVAPTERDLGALPVASHGHADVSSFTFVTTEALDWTAFGVWLTMLLQAHGSRILRVKGLLNVGGAGPVFLNGVQHVFHAPVHLETWPDDDRRTRIVFIGRRLDRERIERSLLAFQESVGASTQGPT